MASDIHETTKAYADHLAGLASDDDRSAAERQKNVLVQAQLPDEEIGKPPVSTLGEYLDREIALPPMLVQPGLVARGAVSAMIARGGKGKTAVSLNRLLRWSMGKPLFDELPDVFCPEDGPLRVLLIENEGAPGHFQKVLRTILSENNFTGDDIEKARENVHIWKDGGWSGLKMDEAEDRALVDRATQLTKADIVFVEPFRGLWKGDENSSTDMAVVLDAFSEIANKHDCGFLLTHHERKSGAGEDGDPMSAARGSGVLEAHAAVMERWRPAKGGEQRELSCIKNRFEEPYSDVRMEFDRQKWSYRYVQEAEIDRAILKHMQQFPNQWMGAKEVADELDETYAKTRRHLNKLETEERVRKTTNQNQVMYTIKDKNGDQEGLAIT
jgi:RecA-family ATPase